MSSSWSALSHGQEAGVAAPAGFGAVFHTGFNAHIGPVFGRFPAAGQGGAAEFLFTVARHHLNGGGMVHGGLLMSLADIALGSTVFEAIGRKPAATVSLNCDFIAAGRLGDRIEGEVRITRQTRSIVFVEGTLAAARSEGKVTLLSATGVWKVFEA